MPLKIIPQAMGHLRVDETNSPFRGFEEGKEVHRDVSKAGLNEDQPLSARQEFPPPPCNPLDDFV